MELTQFSKMMAYLASSKMKKFEAEDFKIWYDLLDDISDDKLRQAFMAFIRGEDDFPTTQKIRDLAEGTDSLPLEAERAWNTLCAVIDNSEEITGPIFKAFVTGYGDRRAYKAIYGEIKNIPYLKKDYIHFHILKKKEQRKEQAMQIAGKTLGMITDGK